MVAAGTRSWTRSAGAGAASRAVLAQWERCRRSGNGAAAQSVLYAAASHGSGLPQIRIWALVTAGALSLDLNVRARGIFPGGEVVWGEVEEHC